MTLPLLAVGGVGVVGTSTHFSGAGTQAMIEAFERGDVAEALRAAPAAAADLHRHLPHPGRDPGQGRAAAARPRRRAGAAAARRRDRARDQPPARGPRRRRALVTRRPRRASRDNGRVRVRVAGWQHRQRAPVRPRARPPAGAQAAARKQRRHPCAGAVSCRRLGPGCRGDLARRSPRSSAGSPAPSAATPRPPASSSPSTAATVPRSACWPSAWSP